MLIKGEHSTHRVWLDGEELFPEQSQTLVNHSPTGFSWGYGGSGPAQLALAILLSATQDEALTLRHYMAFKWQKVAGFADDFEEVVDIEAWLLLQGEIVGGDEFDGIPSHIIIGLQRYLLSHIHPGDFLLAVLRNDLVNAIAYGDNETIGALPIIVRYLTARVRSDAWGSRDKVNQWLSGGA